MIRFCLVATVAIAVLLVGASCLPPQEEVVSSQRNPKWGEADPAVLNASEDTSEPDIYPQTYIAAAALFESQGLYAKAVTQYQKAIAAQPDHPEAYTRLGILLGRIGQHEGAERYLHHAVQLRPRSAPLRNNLGFEYALQERWIDAETEIRNAIQLKPDFKRAYINLGMVLCKQGRYDEGLEAFEQAVPSADAHYNVGLMLRSAQQYTKAAEAFAQALQIDPQLTAAQVQLEQIGPKIPEPAMADPPAAPVVAQQPAVEPIIEAAPPVEPPAPALSEAAEIDEPIDAPPDEYAVVIRSADPCPIDSTARQPAERPIERVIDQIGPMWNTFRTLIAEADQITVQPIADQADASTTDTPAEVEGADVFLTARFLPDLVGPMVGPPAPLKDDEPTSVAVIETPQAMNARMKTANTTAAGEEKTETLCEDWLKLNWAFDENAPPVIFPTACVNDPNTFTPQLRFDPRWHLVRPGAVSLEQNPYEQVETFHPITWELPTRTSNTD
ncbi:MAG: tetratricopeptide repeat protein [Phycisphaerae bacterium]|nr:tetratricopeptide repeat protein [Phycisphaerae bacterium]